MAVPIFPLHCFFASILLIAATFLREKTLSFLLLGSPFFSFFGHSEMVTPFSELFSHGQQHKTLSLNIFWFWEILHVHVRISKSLSNQSSETRVVPFWRTYALFFAPSNLSPTSLSFIWIRLWLMIGNPAACHILMVSFTTSFFTSLKPGISFKKYSFDFRYNFRE